MPALDRAKTLQAAEKLVRAGKLLEAVKEYQKLVDDNPRDMNLVNKLGDLLLRAGKNQDALKQFMRIADFFAKDGFHLKAIAMYKKISKFDPSNLECQQRLATLYHEQGLATEAKSAYKAIADAYVKSGKTPGAAEAFKRLLDLDPDDVKSRMTLAELLARNNQNEDAALQYAMVARVAAARGASDEAVAVVRRAIKLSPTHAELPGVLLSVVTRLDHAPSELVQAAEEIAGHATRSARAVVLMAEALRRAGREDDADEALKRLNGESLDDDLDLEALVVVGRFHTARGRVGEGFVWIDRAVDRLAAGGKAAEAASMVDVFLQAHGDHPEALQKLADLAAKSQDAASEFDALQRLVSSRIDSGHADRARGPMERLMVLRPGDPVVLELQERLKGGAKPKAPAAPAPPPVPETAAAPPRHAAPAASAPAPSRAQSEDEEASEIFNLDEDDTSLPEISLAEEDEDDGEVIEIDADEEEPRAPAAAPARPAPAPARTPAPSRAEPPAAPKAVDLSPLDASDEPDYGPNSRIQEIQDADASGQPIDEEFISEHLTEAEVFVKYGLLDKAREQLRAILKKYPQHDAAHVRMKDLALSEGNTDAAVRECLALAEIRRGEGKNDEARDLVNEAVRIDPDHPELEKQGVAAERPASPRVVPAAAAPAAAAAKPKKAAAPPPPPAPSLNLDDDLEIDLDLPEEAPAAAPARAHQPPAPAAASAARGAKPATPDFASTTAKTVLPLEPEPDESDDLDMLREALAEPDGEKLGEVDFYIEQGLVDEARQILFQLQKRFPGSEAVEDRMRRLEAPAEAAAPAGPPAAGEDDVDFEVEQALTGKHRPIEPPAAPKAHPPAKGREPHPPARAEAKKAAPAPPAAPKAAPVRPVFKVEKHVADASGDFFDLAGELDRSMADEQVKSEATSKDALDGQAHTFEDIFAAFRKGVEQQVGSDDFDTHYNLGIAYKEMGLVDEAIGEFQFAARDPGRALECCGILGLCFRDKGMPELALKWYKRGLDMPGLDEQQAVGLRYDMAEVHREQGEYDQALRMYTEVFGVDSTYREVGSRIKEMKSQLPSSGKR
ncbi:MAG TPA: tetratricopeptide repeat protein [Candidatus Polarisedimenticolia bacterium]|nr:tetratricopeptide repeat protein [Candidatus Polarisedimenticolia bacterium]